MATKTGRVRFQLNRERAAETWETSSANRASFGFDFRNASLAQDYADDSHRKLRPALCEETNAA